MKGINSRITDSKRSHDQRGKVSPEHRCNRHPYNKACGKKNLQECRCELTIERAVKDKTILTLYTFQKKGDSDGESMH